MVHRVVSWPFRRLSTLNKALLLTPALSIQCSVHKDASTNHHFVEVHGLLYAPTSLQCTMVKMAGHKIGSGHLRNGEKQGGD